MTEAPLDRCLTIVLLTAPRCAAIGVAPTFDCPSRRCAGEAQDPSFCEGSYRKVRPLCILDSKVRCNRNRLHFCTRRTRSMMVLLFYFLIAAVAASAASEVVSNNLHHRSF